MFELVSPYELKYNKTYKIVANNEYKGTYIDSFYFHDDEIYLEFVNIKTSDNKLFSKRIFFSSTRTIYKFVSDNPQEKMERRAVNLIVRKLTGDDCFTW